MSIYKTGQTNGAMAQSNDLICDLILTSVFSAHLTLEYHRIASSLFVHIITSVEIHFYKVDKKDQSNDLFVFFLRVPFILKCMSFCNFIFFFETPPYSSVKSYKFLFYRTGKANALLQLFVYLTHYMKTVPSRF